ncbi:MAG: hypothetical protein GY909_04625 [Oligoflexia bacterium]|nr:hypothetical protein [Oligoflexia bacterium]
MSILQIVKILILSLYSTLCWSSIEVFHIKGKASVLKNNLSYSLAKGSKVSVGDEIRVGDKSFVILSFQNNSKLKIDEGTSLIIDEVHINEVGDQGKHTTIDLIKGSLQMHFKHAGKESIVVKHEKVAVAVRGTRFFFAEEEGHHYAHVNSGSIDIFKEDGDHENIKAGHGVVVEKGNLSTPHQYDWGKKLDYQFDGKSKGTSFRNAELRKSRRAEIKKKIQKLRKRKRKVLKSRVLNRMKKVKARRQRMMKKGMKNNLKKRMNSQKKKVTPQEFRKKLRKRLRNRRSR